MCLRESEFTSACAEASVCVRRTEKTRSSSLTFPGHSVIKWLSAASHPSPLPLTLPLFSYLTSRCTSTVRRRWKIMCWREWNRPCGLCCLSHMTVFEREATVIMIIIIMLRMVCEGLLIYFFFVAAARTQVELLFFYLFNFCDQKKKKITLFFVPLGNHSETPSVWLAKCTICAAFNMDDRPDDLIWLGSPQRF